MTPNQLYQCTPLRTTNNLEHLAYSCYNHLKELGQPFVDHCWNLSCPSIEIRFLEESRIDHRRIWQLATVWFQKRPVMIIQNAGREGDDHVRRFITDKEHFIKLCQHVSRMLPVDEPDDECIIDPGTDQPKLTHFSDRFFEVQP